MECRYCKEHCIKYGKHASGQQKYYCRGCNKHQQAEYIYEACKANTRSTFHRLIQRSIGTRSIAYILKISKTTVQRWIIERGASAKPNLTFIKNDEYEIDELRTFVKSKTRSRWVISVLSRTTGKVIEVKVGPRSKASLKW